MHFYNPLTMGWMMLAVSIIIGGSVSTAGAGQFKIGHKTKGVFLAIAGYAEVLFAAYTQSVRTESKMAISNMTADSTVILPQPSIWIACGLLPLLIALVIGIWYSEHALQLGLICFVITVVMTMLELAYLWTLEGWIKTALNVFWALLALSAGIFAVAYWQKWRRRTA